MIKLFRNIRKKLINQGKTSAYLKYAIGEIVLVVIGILIAINLNNGNQNNIEKKQRNEKIKKLRQVVYNDSINLLMALEYNQKNMVRIDSLIAYLKPEMSMEEYSFCTNLFSLTNMQFRTSLPDVSVYNELINSGEFSKIEDIQLKGKISDYYIYYTHFNNLLQKFIDALYVTEKRLYYDGILSHKYFQKDLELTEMADGYKAFLEVMNNQTKRRIFENHLFELKDMHHQIISFYNYIIHNMHGIPLVPEKDD